MAKGDIVLITFPFTDLSGSKLRPAVILAETEEDLTVCFPSSQRLRYGTLRLPTWFCEILFYRRSWNLSGYTR